MSYASALVSDPSGEGDRERKKRYGGTCEKCGGPTDGSNGRAKAPKVCMACITPAFRRDRVRAAYPVWNEATCLESIVRWVERNQRIPRVTDLILAEPGERPCMGTIIRHCYRSGIVEREEWVWHHHRTDWRKSRRVLELVGRREIVRNLHDILVELAPRFPANVVILTAQNALLRSRLFEVIGIEEIVRESGHLIAKDDWGTLWHVPAPPARRDRGPGEPYVVVQVVNSTPEPDGTFKDYFLRVPPECETPRAAIAWTFGVETEEYELAAQT